MSILNVEEIRQDFPILNRLIEGKRLVYFDNAATSQKPVQVINAIKNFYETFNANIHRGLHKLSQEASEKYEYAHDLVADFIGAKNREEVIFVRNTTEALNLVAYSFELKYLKPGDEIVVSIMEHHSNLLPWFQAAKRTKALLRIVDITNEHKLDYDLLEEVIGPKTKVVAIVHMSNMLGTINDVRKIAKLAHENDALVVVDGAQSVSHLPINVSDLGIDFLAFSGHKMLGPTGIGVLYGRRELLESLDPFLTGGDMISSVRCGLDGKCKIDWNKLPWKFEAGTPNIVGGIGLSAAVEYLKRLGMSKVHEYEKELTRYALKLLDEELNGNIEVYGPKNIDERGGIISFNIKNMDPHVVALYLDEFGIAVRSGFHCTQPLHERLGLDNGSVRASFYIYNTKEEIDYFVDALKQIIESEIH
ncbi:MAG: SufS family cysteine desulfurase [Candidatus Odinarchaeota archaeon]|nr:SufS family cysteine desulfurase [Candidatus Odinarchaeota archaeon]